MCRHSASYEDLVKDVSKLQRQFQEARQDVSKAQGQMAALTQAVERLEKGEEGGEGQSRAGGGNLGCRVGSYTNGWVWAGASWFRLKVEALLGHGKERQGKVGQVVMPLAVGVFEPKNPTPLSRSCVFVCAGWPASAGGGFWGGATHTFCDLTVRCLL